MKAITLPQITKIHALLGQMGMGKDKEFKRELIRQYSDGRTDSTAQLDAMEAFKLISDLQKKVRLTPEEMRSDVMRKKIISMAREMGHVKIEDGRAKADMQHIDEWCKKYGYLHKGLNKYSYEELPRLVSQYEQVYNDFISKV
jgi:hypothetical protein